MTLGCNTANAAECVPKTRVTNFHSRVPSLPRKALQASLTPRRAGDGQELSHLGVNQGPHSELVVLFLCEFQVVDVALKTCQLGDTQFCVRRKRGFRSRELRQKRHMTLEISCNFVKSPPYSTATTPFERGVLHVANASAFSEVDQIRFPYCEQGSNHVDIK